LIDFKNPLDVSIGDDKDHLVIRIWNTNAFTNSGRRLQSDSNINDQPEFMVVLTPLQMEKTVAAEAVAEISSLITTNMQAGILT
jgi:hypothetical protein